jgi:hypothetical protein
MPLYTSGPNPSQSGLSTSHETLRSERLALSMEVCDSCAKFDQDELCKAHMATYDAILRNSPELPASLAYFRTPDEGIGLNVDQLEKVKAGTLVYRQIEWLRETYIEDASGEGKLSIQHLSAKLHSMRNDMNRRVVPREADMNDILFILNKTFFAGATPFQAARAFGWLPVGAWHEGDTVWRRKLGVRVWMHLFRVHKRDQKLSIDRPYATFEARMGILCHELCHAFVMSYGRRDDEESWEYDVGKGGHGHVWQHMVMDIEGLLEKFVGLSVDLGRFQSLYLDKALRSKATEKWEVEKYELERTKC